MMGDIFAVNYPGQGWRFAYKQTAREFAVCRGLVADHPEWIAWLEHGSNAWIGYVGNGEQVVVLPDVRE